MTWKAVSSNMMTPVTKVTLLPPLSLLSFNRPPKPFVVIGGR